VDLPFFGPGGPKKDIRFMSGEEERSEALSIPEARRGAEASTLRRLRRAELHKRDGQKEPSGA
jgi:hypothetical protein